MKDRSSLSTTILKHLFALGLGTIALSGCDLGDKESTLWASKPAPGAGSSSATKILAFGDSITFGLGISDPYPSKLTRLSGHPVINAGITSQTSSQGLGRIGGLLSKHKPTHVCILYGSNDVRGGISADSTASNIGAMIDAVQTSGAKAIVGTLPPLPGSAINPNHQSAVNITNARIRTVVGSKGATLADLAHEFGSGAGSMASDGIHPNDNGAAIIAVTFYEKL
ncbi:MAG: GDSL-type esterase/lipase family protein [Verrucomicrobiota bacterium]